MLVVAVATFNIVSGQLMVVAEKQGDIAILRTMGASSRVIRRAFTVQGLLIAALGIVSGLGLGVWVASNIAALVSWLGEVTSYRLLQGTYFAALPTEIRAADLAVIGAIAGGLSLLAAFIPAARAADLEVHRLVHSGAHHRRHHRHGRCRPGQPPHLHLYRTRYECRERPLRAATAPLWFLYPRHRKIPSILWRPSPGGTG